MSIFQAEEEKREVGRIDAYVRRALVFPKCLRYTSLARTMSHGNSTCQVVWGSILIEWISVMKGSGCDEEAVKQHLFYMHIISYGLVWVNDTRVI